MTFEWAVPGDYEVRDYPGMPSVIAHLEPHLRATDGENTVATGFIIDLPAPDKANFLPVEQVTVEMVKAWLDKNVDPALLAAKKLVLVDDLVHMSQSRPLGLYKVLRKELRPKPKPVPVPDTELPADGA